MASGGVKINSLNDISLDILIPEIIMTIGMLMIIIIPNMGDAKIRLPLSKIHIPVLIGGTRFTQVNNPIIPSIISIITFGLATLMSLWMLLNDDTGVMEPIIEVNQFTSLFSMIFTFALLLTSISSLYRLPSQVNAKIPDDSDSEKSLNSKITILMNNRRQVDFYILLLMAGLGMCLVAKSTHLFMLFVCLELASLSSYVLVAFNKESAIGGEAGTKYFIVGSVASAIGIYGMSLLYIWNGNLEISSLTNAWTQMDSLDPFAGIGIGLMLVAFGFKVGAAPFHLATPDAYSGASSPIAGLLATASKAMGFVAMMRVLLIITIPENGEEAYWMIALAIISIITMTWGNFAALTSTNPKRMLAYSSVAHAGYMLAALAAIGTGLGDEESNVLILTAIIFHLTILVLFKFGAFMVLTLIENEGNSHNMSGLHGLARRDPIIASSMFIFMLSLAGVPPLSGFLSKLLMINGIVNISAGTGSMASVDIWTWASSVNIIFWLAMAIVINSAISLFYYLRVVMIMFFEDPITNKPLARSLYLRLIIIFCAVLTLLFGIGPLSESLLETVNEAAQSFL
ncbi:MAG: NADH-quinone oxidoreductase subunit N [Candidatus Poseidoniales archaeon]|tara:strand:- start:24706 stop:26415 length:1710 start_codon:yes stop_codon:yes gene_type:complete